MSTNNVLKNNALRLLICLIISTAATAQVPLANFTGSPVSGCSPVIVNFQDLSTNSPTSLFWDFGNGNTSTASAPTAIYVNPGTYTVKLIAKNASGSDTLTRTNYVTVYSFPTLDFTADKTDGCFPVTVKFTDLSTPGAGNTNTTWEWNFGDGAVSTAQNPTHTYTAAGNFTVTLKVTTDKGCSKILNKNSYIIISSGVVADFTKSSLNVCSTPATVDFTSTSTGPGTLSYLWNFGDGATSTLQNPSHIYNNSGAYTVTLQTTSSLGCSGTEIKTNEVVIGINSTSFSAPATGTTNTPINFANTSLPSPPAQTWDFGDGTTSTTKNPVKTYATPGTYVVTLTNNYGSCSSTVTKTIVITPRSTGGFTASETSNCKPPLTVNFQSIVPDAISWLWDFGDSTTVSTSQNPAHTYTKYGSFDVKLITKNSAGRSDTLVKFVFINIKKPDIKINGLPPDGGCLPLVINPIPNITTSGTVTSYQWDFGDGGTSTLQNPSHTYTTTGRFDLRLIIITSQGCTDTLIVKIKAGTPTTADFSAAPPLTVCVGVPVQFTDQSSSNTNEWLWNFGDNTTSTVKNPAHAFNKPGIYSVMLTANQNGCGTNITKPALVTVLPPASDFNILANCSNPTQFTFTDNSIGALTWFWTFSDGTTYNSQNPPTHNFPGLGSYDISLTTTNGGCTHTITKTIKAFVESPNFTSNITTTCREKEITFTPTNLTPSNISSYVWDFGDGTQSYADTIGMKHKYLSAGVFTVTLITTDVNGCNKTITKTNYISISGPKINFSAVDSGDCSGFTATFNDLTVTDGVHPIIFWKWDFGDGSVQSYSAGPFTHTYDSVGTFPVTLMVVDALGCTDTLGKTDFIYSTDPSSFFFSYDTISCPGAQIRWGVNTTGINHTILWDFGDGTSVANVFFPPKSYSAPGDYTVKLFVTDYFGCKDSLVRPNYIKVSIPQASFTVADTASFCNPFEAKFTNTSTNYTNQLWTFEPGATSTVKNPAHYFTTPGLFNVELIVSSSGGCSDTAYRTIRLYDIAGSKITYNPLTGCKPRAVSFNAVINGPATLIWDFGDGQTSVSSTPSITHVYNQFGNFVPKVILQDPSGCITPITGFETVQLVGATPKFGLDKSFLCDAGMIKFIDSTTFNDPVTNYYWDFGDGTTSTLQTPSHFYSGIGYYNVTLAVKTVQGCADTIKVDSVLRIATGPNISITGDSAMCVFAPLQFYGTLNVSDTSAISWKWDFGNNATSTLQNPASQSFNKSGNFVTTLVATNSFGCKDTTTRNILIHSLPTVSLPADTAILAGTTITIPANYSSTMTNYLWSPATFLNCTSCPQPSVTPDNTTRYTVDFSDSNNCRNSGTILVKTLCKNANLFVPNTFSPNGDGSNDVFYPRGTGIDKARFFRIFNRWGEVVFERYDMPINSSMHGWDGTWKGKKANADVYIYQVEVYCQSGELISSTGNVTLIR